MKKNVLLIAAALFCGAALFADTPQGAPAPDGKDRPARPRAEHRQPGRPGMQGRHFSETDRVIYILAEAYKATDNEETRAAIEKELKARLTEAITKHAQAESEKLKKAENDLAQKLADPEKFADEIFKKITSRDFKPGFAMPGAPGQGFGPGQGFVPGAPGQGFGPGQGFAPGGRRGPGQGFGPGGRRGPRGNGNERRPDVAPEADAPEDGGEAPAEFED